MKELQIAIAKLNEVESLHEMITFGERIRHQSYVPDWKDEAKLLEWIAERIKATEGYINASGYNDKIQLEKYDCIANAKMLVNKSYHQKKRYKFDVGAISSYLHPINRMDSIFVVRAYIACSDNKDGQYQTYEWQINKLILPILRKELRRDGQRSSHLFEALCCWALQQGDMKEVAQDWVNNFERLTAVRAKNG